MPLARIVTSTPEQVSAAADHLRARGYTVEVLTPDESSAGAADIDIDARGRTSQDVLSLALEASQSKPRRVVAYDLTGRPVEYASDDEQEEQAPRRSMWAGMTAALREIGENVRLSLDHLREWVHEGRESIAEKRAERSDLHVEQQPGKLQQHEDQQAPQRVRQDEEERARLAVSREQQARLEAEESARRAMVERERQQALEHERAAREADERRRREEEERLRQAAMAEERRREEERRQALAAEQARHEQERLRQQQIAEEKRRREQEHAAEEARLARERQMQAKVEDEHRQAAERQRLARIVAEREQFVRQQREAAQRTAAAETTIQHRPRPMPANAGRDGDWKKAVVSAAVLALLATLAYAAYTSRHAPAPLSNRDLIRSQGISQPVPFGAATATPPPASSTTRPQARLPQNSAEPPAQRPAPSPTAKTKLKRQARRYTDDTVADDTVVVHRTSTPPPPSSAKGSGPKQYSDMQQ